MHDLSTVITFSIYFLLMMGIGYLGYRATASLSDYIWGGRRLGSFVTALSAGASDMSGWLLMGLPGAVYLSGLSSAWIAVGLIIGAWLNWTFVAGRLRVYTEKCANALTLPDYLSRRFGDHTHVVRMMTALFILIFFTLYCASGVVAGARLFESMFGLPYTIALCVGAVVTISYVFVGGFLAVSWTDTVQASLMLIALVTVPLMTIHYNHVVAQHVDMVHVSMSGIGIISLLAWGLGYFGQPHILVRFMASTSVKVIPAARRIGMTWMVLCLSGAIAIGFFGMSFHVDNPETIFIELTKQLLAPWLVGIFLAAILAAVMSTLSCQLLVCSSALTEDIYKALLRKQASQKELVWFGRAMVLLVAAIALVMALNPDSKVLTMVSYAWAGFGATFGPIVLISLFWARATKAGAIAGMLVGAVTVLVWEHYAWFGLYEMIPGFVFSTLAIVIVSLLTAKPSDSIIDTFKQVQQEMRA